MEGKKDGWWGSIIRRRVEKKEGWNGGRDDG